MKQCLFLYVPIVHVFMCICVFYVAAVSSFLCAQVNDIITVLGLRSCKDVYVGNAMIRGVSGGQMRRVTVGEMMLLREYRAELR